MNNPRLLLSMLKADFLERTRRSSFLVTLCLVIYLGYAVNAGQILIKLDTYRGIYNSAWVGSLMALVITFFLGITGFYLVKNSIERDERTGVGQIIATTPLTRTQYLLGKWLSNFALLSALVGILMVSAIVMQLIHRESAQINIWVLIAPFLFVALPMMGLVAAFSVFFETVSWLKGGFGNLVYFFVFIGMFMAGVFLTEMPWLDVTGISLLGTSMKAAARASFPDYQGSFVLSMISDKPLQTFVWQGVKWTLGLIVQRLLWLALSVAVVLSGALFFDRFDPSKHTIRERRAKPRKPQINGGETELHIPTTLKESHLTPMPANGVFHFNFLHLAWLEFLLLVKGLKWYWLAGMAALWIMCVASPTGNQRNMAFMLSSIWPVLVWSRMGEREIRYQTEQLLYHSAHSLLRPLLAAWLAGTFFTALAFSGALIGRLADSESAALTQWALAVLFVPTLALTLGVWGRSSKLFEVVYPILWYLGPFNRENGLAVLDYMGIHALSPVNVTPLLFLGAIFFLLAAAIVGRRQRMVV